MSNVIPGFESLTKQQIFDMAAKHVLKNGRASVDRLGRCVYTGIGCAASPFLTQEARKKHSGVVWATLAREGLVPPHNVTFIDDVQYCHDRPAVYPDTDFISDFKHSMKLLAKRSGLNTFVLDETHRGE